MLVADVGRADVDARLPALGERALALGRQQPAGAQLPNERTPMFSAIDHCGNTPSDWRSPATSATGALISAAGAPAARRVEGGEQQVGLAVAGEAREADDLAAPRDELVAVALPLGADAHLHRRFASRPVRRRGFRRGRVRLDAAHRADQAGAVESCAASATTTLPSRMTTMRSSAAGLRRGCARSACSSCPAATARRI